jgi:hypothetical protein
VVGFEISGATRSGVLEIGHADDHNLGLFESRCAPDERVARMYHSAWEVTTSPTWLERRASSTLGLG